MVLLFSRVLWAFAFCLSFPLGLVGQEPLLPYEEGRRILHQEGPEAAIAYFEKLAIEKGSLKGLFGLAWAWWEDGNIDEAELIAKFVLRKAETENLKANCNFLLGYIYSQKEELASAELHMTKARAIYAELDKNDNLYKSLCGLASIQIKSQNFLEAEVTLSEASVVYQRVVKAEDAKVRIPTQGYYFELLSRVAFGLGEFAQALAHSEASYSNYEQAGDKIRAVQAMSAVGFYKIINGRITEGLEDTRQVDEEIYATENEYKRLSYYNAINWIVAYRCSGHDYKTLVESVEQAIQANKDLLLMKHLKFALSWNCGK